MKEFIAGSNENDMRLSRFVEHVTNQLPTSLLYKSFRNKRIKVNHKKASPDTRLQEGDLIQLYLNDEFFSHDIKIQQKKILKKPTILYENEAMAILYKPARLLCHSDQTGDETLLERFQNYLTQTQQFHAKNELTFTPALCNRLDRGTEGLVLAAKTYDALRILNEAIRTNRIEKEYYAITCSVPPSGHHTAYLKHYEKGNRVVVQKMPHPEYKEIITEIVVEKVHAPFALCKIRLITGRTHQIRAHLAYLGAPILGDMKYGSKKMNHLTHQQTQALCAVSLKFGDFSNMPSLHTISGLTYSIPNPKILDLFEQLCKDDLKN